MRFYSPAGTMTDTDARARIRFDSFELDFAAYELRRGGAPVRLERKPMEVLMLLLERRGQLVSREDIIDRLWGADVFVDVETGINTAIRKIRIALRDPAEAPRFVQTVPGKGYRFAAPVELVREPVQPGAPVRPDPSPPAAVAAAPAPRRSTLPLVLGLAAVGLLVAAAALITFWRQRAAPAAPAETLAVLPFVNISGDPARDYLADGLVEEIIASLGRIDPAHVMVIGRTSVMTYKGGTKSLAVIGKELGVDYLVEGSVRAEADQLRVTAKLIRVRDQVQIWSESYDRSAASALSLQRELSAAIAQQVRLRLSPERLDALARRQTGNAEAYDLYLRGRGFINQRTPATTAKALEYLQRATALDPTYALAWAGLAEAYAASPINGDADPLLMAPLARQAAQRAMAADRDLAEAQFAAAYMNWMYDWNWPAAVDGFRRAAALDPGLALNQVSLGHVLSQMGRHEEAETQLKRTRDVDPLNPMVHAIRAQVAFQARHYSAAVEHARQAMTLDDGFWIGHMEAGQAYAELGQPELAFERFAAAARLSGGNSKPLSNRGHLLARLGRTAEAREMLAALTSAAATRYVPPYAVALIHAGLGERDAVFAWLERAYAVRDVHLIFLTADPKWDPYRADPRFTALVKRCGFR
ncbi:MAG TPA: winged helix-turn-helix domain-containing protein [Vicinamibacterales bacterium]|nr:winged helix-turn-helix domain-containing protein [Vicinamibacterales bacterium]